MEVEEPPYLPPIADELQEDAMEIDLEGLPVDMLGEQPLADLTKLMNTSGKWRGRRPQGDWRTRAAATDFDDPKSVNANFPPFKDKTKYGQLQVPQALLDQFGQNRNKVSAIMSWRRMTSNQQKQIKAQFNAEASEHRTLERYLIAEDLRLYRAEQAEQEKWHQHLREASKWSRKLDKAQSAFDTAQASGNTGAMLKAIHTINSLGEASFRRQLRAEEKRMEQSDKEARQALRAAREEEEIENQVVSFCIVYLFCFKCIILPYYIIFVFSPSTLNSTTQSKHCFTLNLKLPSTTNIKSAVHLIQPPSQLICTTRLHVMLYNLLRTDFTSQPNP
jgi:hypothetical protein